MTSLSYDIVILGGGFAGATLASRLEDQLPSDVRIALVSSDNYVTFSPLLPEVVGASILPGHVVAPLRQMISRTELLMAEVTAIHLGRGQLDYRGEGPGAIRYQQLVLACGQSARLTMVPGMAEHALPLKTLGDALVLRNQLIARLEHAQLEPDPERRRWLTTYAIVGVGFSGVEVAGEALDFLQQAVRYYPAVDARDCRIVLVHSGDRLLPELSPDLGAFAYRKMAARGIDVRFETRATRIDAQGMELQDGERIEAGSVVTTVGNGSNPLVAQLALPMQRDQLITNPDMSVPDQPGLWAIGDCAAVPNAYDDRVSPPTAQFATRQAHQLADNLARSLEGRSTAAFSYRPLGQLASIGHNKAVAEVFGIRLYGFVAWLLWRGVYLLKLPTLPRKMRVFLEWNWEMLFPPDTVSLRFSRTGRSHGEAPGGDRG